MRIGTFGNSQAMIQQMLRQQTDLVETQRQVATGTKYDDVKGFGAGTSSLLSSHSILNRLDGFYDSNKSISGRLNAFDHSLTELEGIGNRLRDALFTARGTGDGTGLVTEIDSLFQQASSIMNTRFEGRFLFGGSVSDQPPMAIETTADLLATAEPPAGSFFNDQGDPNSIRLDERTTVTVGNTASQVGEELLHTMQRILMFDAGTLPTGAGAFAPASDLDQQLDGNQAEFLQSELDRVLGAIDTMKTAATDNALNLRTVEDVQLRIEDQRITLSELIADKEDADLGETAIRLNQQQVALEASFRMIAQMRQLSLVNLL